MTSSDDNRTGVCDQGFIEQGLERLVASSRPCDAEGLLARAVDVLRVAHDATDHEVELFVRHSRRVRVRRERGDDRASAVAGVELGTATRIRGGDGRIGFVARSGFDEVAVRASVAAAVASASQPGEQEPSWARGDGATLRDLDEAPMPSVGELGGWLDAAWSELQVWRDERRRDAVELVDGWIEVAATVEVFLASDGLRAVRTRCRGRARARTSSRRPAGEPSALDLAARDWRRLEHGGWVGLLRDRVRPGMRRATVVNPKETFVFSPESASTLVQALVMALSGHEPLPAIGPGWCVRDEPDGGAGEFGGRFDDAGFPADPVLLADGNRVCGPLPTAGRLRRGSYRDRPAPRPWRLIVEPPQATIPPHALLVSACRVLPLGSDRWCLELETAALEGGVPTATHQTSLVMTDPATIVERCVGGTGATRSLSNGVRTPALLFDGLRGG